MEDLEVSLVRLRGRFGEGLGLLGYGEDESSRFRIDGGDVLALAVPLVERTDMLFSSF